MSGTRTGDRNRLLVHPAAARVVLEMLRGPTDGGRDITPIVMADPALAASVLRAANSAHLGYSRRIGSIRQAAVMLGGSLVGSLAASRVADLVFDTEAPDYPDWLWLHSVTMGCACSVLARHIGQSVDDAFTVGLLHDVGWLLAASDGITLPSSDTDRTTVGAELLARWNLPERIVGAVRQHHTRTNASTLHVDEVPPALHAAGFTDMAADQIASGLSRVVEGEQLRRKAAAAKALRAVAGLDERWSGAELEDIAFAIAALPAVTGATINATAARFADTITVDAGRQGPHQLERQFTVDGQLVVSLVVGYAEMPAADHIARLDDVVEALNAGLERIEQNIRLAAEADTDQLTGVGNRRRASKALAQARSMADTKGQPMSVLLCDLDHFKLINDRFGHDAGDRVLTSFA